jgi:PAS domain S-box-containing protein
MSPPPAFESERSSQQDDCEPGAAAADGHEARHAFGSGGDEPFGVDPAWSLRLLETDDDLVVCFDEAFRFTYANAQAERLIGWSRAELVGQSLFEVFPTALGSPFEAQCKAAFRSQQPSRQESYYPHRGIWLALTLTPLGKWLAVRARDMTERKRRERSDAIMRAVGTALGASDRRLDTLRLFATTVMDHTGWPYAEIWAPAHGSRAFACTHVVRKDDPTLALFEQHTRSIQLAPGEGLIGEAVALKRPLLVRSLEETARLTRAEAATLAELSRAVVLPVVVAGEVIAVVAFFGNEARPEADGFELTAELAEPIAHQLERRLAQLELERFFSLSLDMLSVSGTDGFFKRVNPAFVEALGYSAEELLSSPYIERVLPEDRDATLRELAKVSRGEASRAFENRYVAKDGSVRWISWTAERVSQDGFIYAIARDVTERHRMEDVLREQAALLETANDAIVVRALDDTVTFWNGAAERMWRCSRDEALGKPLRSILAPAKDAYEDAFRTVLAEGEWRGELTFQRDDGSEMIVENRWTLVRDARDRPKSVLMIGTDVTERKALETQYFRAQRMESIGTLAGGIAHDLNNVLTPILMSIEVLKNATSEKQRRSTLELVELSARRGAEMVRQVLSFARGVQGKRVPVAVPSLVSDIERIARESVEKSIEIRTRVAPDVRAIAGDPTQLQQVVLNLVVNARDAMPDGGVLTIEAANADDRASKRSTTSSAAGEVVLRVTDTGIGIPREIRERIFDPFFTTKGVGHGTGLGLATVLAIVKSHHGSIHVESTVGAGTTFEVRLPAAESPVCERHDNAPALPRGSGELVLVVDDEPAVRTSVRETLEAFGYRVLVANGGAQAEEIYGAHAYAIDAVVTDASMPDTNGETVVRTIRRIRPDACIVVTSGLPLEGELASLVTHFVAKPFSAADLLSALKCVLARPS